MVDAHLVPSDASLLMLRKEFPKRLVLVNKKPRTKRQGRMVSKPSEHQLKTADLNPRLKNCGKSKSLDSSDIFPNQESTISSVAKKKPEDILEVDNSNFSGVENNQSSISVIENSKNSNNKTSKRDFFSSPLMRRKKTDVNEQSKGRSSQKKSSHQADANEKNCVSIHTQALANLEKLITRLREDDSKSSPSHSPRLPRSSPSSPAPTKKGNIIITKHIFKPYIVLFYFKVFGLNQLLL